MTTTTEIREKPILFSGPMVRAILDGRKTQTRRVVNPSNSDFGSAPAEFWEHADLLAPYPGTLVDGVNSGNQYLHVPCHCQDAGGYTVSNPVVCGRCKEMGWEGSRHRLRCRWESGMRLWVRETWRPLGVKCGCYEQPCDCCNIDVLYAADGAKRRFDEWTISSEWECPKAAERGNVPGIHMPRWASRITLEITGIRVERLQDISEADAYAEGVTIPAHQAFASNGNPELRNEARCAYQTLWESINGPGSWDRNPWVWVVEFRKL